MSSASRSELRWLDPKVKTSEVTRGEPGAFGALMRTGGCVSGLPGGKMPRDCAPADRTVPTMSTAEAAMEVKRCILEYYWLNK